MLGAVSRIKPAAAFARVGGDQTAIFGERQKPGEGGPGIISLAGCVGEPAPPVFEFPADAVVIEGGKRLIAEVVFDQVDVGEIRAPG